MDDWNESIIDLRKGMRFQDKNKAIYGIQKWSIQMEGEYKVARSNGNCWTAKCAHSNDENFCQWYIRIKRKATHKRWEITVFRKEHTCLVQIVGRRHRNMSSKYFPKQIREMQRRRRLKTKSPNRQAGQ